MAKVLYNTSIYLYQALMRLVAMFHPKAKLWVDGRKDWYQLMQKAVLAKGKAPVAWFHCASLGEFEQGRPVIEAFKKAFPEYQILLTFFSPSGYEVRKNYDQADFIFYLPVDTPANAQRFVALFQPKVAFFVKYEFWHNYLNALVQSNAICISFSAIFRPQQIFFRWYGGFNRSTLRYFTHIFVQNEVSLKLLQQIGLSQISIGGDTRFDRVKQIADAKKEILPAKIFKGNTKVFIVGSCWKEDFEVLCPFINDFKEELKIIIAPHEINPAEIATWQQMLLKKSVLYSEATQDEAKLATAQVLFIDNIGMLSSLYQYAEYAWIGGAYHKGLHNTLEAATFGLPIFFGNKTYTKFQEAMQLIALEGAFPIADTAEFTAKFLPLYQNEAFYQQKSQAIRQFVGKNLGATQQIINFVQSFTAKSSDV